MFGKYQSDRKITILILVIGTLDYILDRCNKIWYKVVCFFVFFKVRSVDL